MRMNWHPTKPAFLDFETQSPVPLNTANMYAKHPLTRALTCVVKTTDGKVHKMGPYLDDLDKRLLMGIAQTHTMVAHNAAFDGAIWEHTLKLPEVEWYDTLPCARAAGLPGKLDDLGKLLTGEGKSKHGKMLVDMLCIVRGPVPPKTNPAYGLLTEYCARDVELLETVFHRVHGYGEPDVMSVDRIINDRGVPLCRGFLEQVKALYDENAEYAAEEFEHLTDGVNPNSPKQVTAWMARLGFDVSRVDKATLREFMADPDKYYTGDSDMSGPLDIIREALEHRQEIVKVGASKVNNALNAIESDDRIREMFVYYGAGPGRWSGRTMQLHNMPLAVKDLDVRNMEMTSENVQAAANEATVRLEYNVAVADVINSSIRHSVRADNLLVADYNAVELRCVMWLAECQRGLQIMNDPLGKSIYLDYGSKAFGRPIKKSDVREYALSKSLVLGCIYGMSATKFAWTLQRRSKVAIKIMAEAGATPQQLVKLFRDTYWEIPQLWADLGAAAMECVRENHDTEVGRIYFHRHGPDMHMVLPSGRPIVYRNVRIEPAVPKWQLMLGLTPSPVDTVFYDSSRFKNAFLYGSKICENASQGTCRDLLARALVNWESAKFHTVLHVHDEGGAEDPPERFDEFMEIMSAPPKWADGFPILVEGYSGPLWTKVSKGYTEATWFNGRKLK